jgi:hypothetical protein
VRKEDKVIKNAYVSIGDELDVMISPIIDGDEKGGGTVQIGIYATNTWYNTVTIPKSNMKDLRVILDYFIRDVEAEDAEAEDE